jgi:hypothetical protein
MNKKLLKSKIRASTGARAMLDELVELLHISKTSLVSKTNGYREFKPSEIDLIRIKYGLTADDVVEIFIKQKGE